MNAEVIQLRCVYLSCVQLLGHHGLQPTRLFCSWIYPGKNTGVGSVQFSSVTQSCPTLCNPMNCSMPGRPVHHQLPECTQTHVGDVIQPSISSSDVPFSFCPQPFPASGSFQMSQLFTSDGQSIGISASASVLPMKTQD